MPVHRCIDPLMIEDEIKLIKEAGNEIVCVYPSQSKNLGSVIVVVFTERLNDSKTHGSRDVRGSIEQARKDS